MFEVDGASDVVSEALPKAGKLPIKVGFVDRNNVGDITFNHKFVDSLKGKGKALKSRNSECKHEGILLLCCCCAASIQPAAQDATARCCCKRAL